VDTRTKLRKRVKNLKRKKLVVGLSLATLGLGTISTVVPNFTTTVNAETLEQLGIDPTRFKAAIAAGEEAYANESLYTEESFAAFHNINGDAPLKTDYYISQLKLLTSVDTLNPDYFDNYIGVGNGQASLVETALAKLVLKPATDTLNLDALRAAIQSSENLVETDYTTESWAVFNQALINATFVEGYVTNGETVPYTYTQADIDEFSNNLVNAINALMEITPVDPSETYGQLQLANATAVINEYYSLNQPSYTIESWVALSAVSNDVDFLNEIINKPADESISEGETIVNLQAKVDSSVSSINAAIAALELVPIVPPQVVSDVFTVTPKDVKVGETVNFTYTVTLDDGTAQNGFSYYGIESNLLVKGGDQPVLTSPTLETINGTTWTPSKAGDYVIYLSFKPEGSDVVTIKYVSVKVSETSTGGNDNGNGNGGNTKPVDPTPAPTDPSDGVSDKDSGDNNNEATASKNENKKDTTNETNSSKDTNSSKQNKENSKTADELPKTGEHSSLALGFSGFGVILLALVTWFRKRRKA
jgi:LPXTG-motif cell wall-anchored protein